MNCEKLKRIRVESETENNGKLYYEVYLDGGEYSVSVNGKTGKGEYCRSAVLHRITPSEEKAMNFLCRLIRYGALPVHLSDIYEDEFA